MSATLSERAALVGVIHPQAVNNTSATSTVIDFQKIAECAFVVLIGATDATVDVKLQAGNAANLSDAADISSKAVTQYGATDDNKQVILRLSAAELSALGKRYARAVVTVGSGATGAQVALAVLADGLRYSAAADVDLASVKQVVS